MDLNSGDEEDVGLGTSSERYTVVIALRCFALLGSGFHLNTDSQ